ncbi:Uncharacterised protein [Vibrio cholerae]|nr:Uncharacterised protein [Vibrio cholerae]
MLPPLGLAPNSVRKTTRRNPIANNGISLLQRIRPS